MHCIQKWQKEQIIYIYRTWIYATCLLVTYVNKQACSPLVWTYKNGNKLKKKIEVKNTREYIHEAMVLMTKP